MGDGAQYTEVIIWKLVDETSGPIDRIVERAKRGKDTLDALAKEAAANQLKEAKQIAREEEEIAKALFKYRTAAAKEEHAIAKELNRFRIEGSRLEEQAAKNRLNTESLVHNRIMQMQQEERMARLSTMAASSGGGGISVGQGLRVGAGIAGATGNFQAAAGLYAVERVAEMAGVADTAMGALSLTTLGFGAALAAVAVAGGALFAGDEFTRTLADMSTLLLDDTVKAQGFAGALQATAESALRVSDHFNIGLIEVVKGFKEALSSGIEAADLERFGNAAGEMSRALGTSFASASNILTSFRDAYHLTVSDLSHVNDVLFNIINLGKVNAAELQSNLGRVLPLAQQAGVSIEDLGAGIAALTRRGATASQAVTSLADVINKLQNPSKGVAKELDKLGISYGKAAIEGKHFSEIFGDIVEKTHGDADIISRLFPDIRGKRGVASLVEGAALLKQIEGGITATGTSAIAASRAMASYGEVMGRAFSEVYKTFQALGSQLGQKGISFLGPDSEAQVKRMQNIMLGMVPGIGLLANVILAYARNVEDAAKADKIWADGQRESVEKITSYKDKVVEAYKDIGAAYRKAADDHDALATKAQEKSDKNAMANFSTDFEKKQVDSLEKQIDGMTAGIEKAKASINSMAAAESRALGAKLGLPGMQAAYSQATDAAVMATLKAQMDAAHAEIERYMSAWMVQAEAGISKNMGGSALDKLEKDLSTLTDKIKSRNSKPVESTKESMETFMHSIGLPTMGELESQAKRIDSYKQSMKDRALEIATHLYETDQRLFKKFEDAKQHDIDKTLSKLETARQRSESLLNRLRDEGMDAEMQKYAGNSRKQKLIAGEQFDSGVSEIQGHLKAGNISQKVFDSLIAMIDQASKARQGASGQEDAMRAARGRGEDVELMKGLVNEFMKMQEGLAAKDIAGAKAQKYSKLSQAEAAKLGTGAAEVEMQSHVKLDARIDVNIKAGALVSESEKLQIQGVVLELMNKALKNSNTYSPYTPESR